MHVFLIVGCRAGLLFIVVGWCRSLVVVVLLLGVVVICVGSLLVVVCWLLGVVGIAYLWLVVVVC